jgi:hypothetical protein
MGVIGVFASRYRLANRYILFFCPSKNQIGGVIPKISIATHEFPWHT